MEKNSTRRSTLKRLIGLCREATAAKRRGTGVTGSPSAEQAHVEGKKKAPHTGVRGE